MTRLLSLGASALLAAACGLAACDGEHKSAAEIGREAGESVDNAAAKLKAATRDFSARASQKLDDLDAKITSLRARASAGAADERARLETLSDDLKRKKDDIAADLRALGDATAEQWDKLKAKIESALDDLERRIRDATS